MISSSASIGAFCQIADDAVIGEGARLEQGCIVYPGTVIGRNTTFGPYCVIGGRSGMIDRSLSLGSLVIGDDNVFGPRCTVDVGFNEFSGATKIGNDNNFVAGCHVGHDTRIGHRNTFGAETLLSGHVEVEDDAYLVTGTLIHPRRRIGRMSYVGSRSRVCHDIPPFIAASGFEAKYRSINKVGLQRRSIPPSDIRALFRFYATIRQRGALTAVSGTATPMILEAVEFLLTSPSGILLLCDKSQRSSSITTAMRR